VLVLAFASINFNRNWLAARRTSMIFVRQFYMLARR
jgi:hypothetical protein